MVWMGNLVLLDGKADTLSCYCGAISHLFLFLSKRFTECLHLIPEEVVSHMVSLIGIFKYSTHRIAKVRVNIKEHL